MRTREALTPAGDEDLIGRGFQVLSNDVANDSFRQRPNVGEQPLPSGQRTLRDERPAGERIEPIYAAAHLSFDGVRTPLGPIGVLNCLLDPKATELHVSDFASNYPEEIEERVLAHWGD
jgi:hypothetical protein